MVKKTDKTKVDLDILKTDLVLYSNPKTKYELSVNAFCLLLKITAFYNESLELDFNNRDVSKWYIYKYRSHDSWSVAVSDHHDNLYYPAGLYYATKELAEKSLKEHRVLWDQFFMFDTN